MDTAQPWLAARLRSAPPCLLVGTGSRLGPRVRHPWPCSWLIRGAYKPSWKWAIVVKSDNSPAQQEVQCPTAELGLFFAHFYAGVSGLAPITPISLLQALPRVICQMPPD